MELQEFLAEVGAFRVPRKAPSGLNENLWRQPCFQDDLAYMKARDFCTERGMWALATQDLAEQLAAWIGDRAVLEIMAGAGWLARALSDAGVRVVATDDGSWERTWFHRFLQPVYEVLPVEASVAVQTIPADVLLCSWPPYDDEAITAAAMLWGSERPIIYLGEGYGGCNAPESFWRSFREEDAAPVIPLMRWPGIHDSVVIGYFGGGHADAAG